MTKKEAIDSLSGIVKDCLDQFEALNENDQPNAWDTNDMSNWNAMAEELSKIKEYVKSLK